MPLKQRAGDFRADSSPGLPAGRSGPADWIPLVVVLLLALYPLFAGLGTTILWEDEADTAIFARNIARFGLPLAWDGKTFTDSDNGKRVAPSLFGVPLVMVGTPWLPYYATAASFAAFGESSLTARLPFALASLGTVALLYALMRRATGDRRAAFAAAVLLICSTQFLLYARECRSYPFNMLLTVAVFVSFLRLGERRGDPWFVLSGIALFHTQFLAAAIALGVCGGLALVHPAFRAQRRPLLLRVPWIAAFTAPWLPLSWSGVGANWDGIAEAAKYPEQIGQLAAESVEVVPLLGWALGLSLLSRRLRGGDRRWLVLGGGTLLVYLLLTPLILDQFRLANYSLRYVCGIIPIAAGITGLIVARASEGRPARFAGLLMLFGATHLAGGAVPWLILGESRILPGPVRARVPRDLAPKLLNLNTWWFLKDLGKPIYSTAAALAALLREEAQPDDVILTNYSWETLYFETNLAQGLRIHPVNRLFPQAQALGLPVYVFNVDDADWLLWRPSWHPLQGMSLPRLRAFLEARGARLEFVRRYPETHWANRPELHFHRFREIGFPYAPHTLGAQGIPYEDALVFRVHWD